MYNNNNIVQYTIINFSIYKIKTLHEEKNQELNYRLSSHDNHGKQQTILIRLNT